MKLSALLPISTAPPRRTSFSRRNSSPALKATRGNIHVRDENVFVKSNLSLHCRGISTFGVHKGQI